MRRPLGGSAMTERRYFGHGGDDRYYMASSDPDYVTVEQLATILGVVAGTLRDHVTDRANGGAQPLGVKVGNTWLIHKADALELIAESWGYRP